MHPTRYISKDWLSALTNKDEILNLIRDKLVASEIPDIYRAHIDQHFLAHAMQDLIFLVVPVLDIHLILGRFDALADLLECLLAHTGPHQFFHLMLAEVERRSGRLSAASAHLSLVDGSDHLRIEVAAQAWQIQRDSASLLHLSKRLARDPRWVPHYHGMVIHAFIERGETDQAHQFFAEWFTQRSMNIDVFSYLEAAMLLGLKPQVEEALAYCRGQMTDALRATIGDITTPTPPYTDQIENDLIQKIDAAFAAPAPEPRYFGREWPEPDQAAKILFVTQEATTINNDLAEQLTESAAWQAIDFDLHCDTALTIPFDFRGTDQEIKERFDRLESKIETSRPNILIVDCCAPHSRGNIIYRYHQLRKKFHFRLVSLFRDSHEPARLWIDAWLPVCDSMIVFDHDSSALKNYTPDLTEKVIVLPIPTFHPPFLEQPDKDMPLTFIGSSNSFFRRVLLAELTNVQLRFIALFGPKRARMAPDFASYARVLGRARAILNVSCHGLGLHLITARVWECIAASSLLVEQENPVTVGVLTPYRHFLPWKNVSDIAHIAHFVERHPDIAQKIARHAHDWTSTHFGNDYFWRKLTAHALRSLAANDSMTPKFDLDDHNLIATDPSLVGRVQYLQQLCEG